jgi:hypothetical protein
MQTFHTHAEYKAACTDVRTNSYKPPAEPYQWVCASCAAVLPDSASFGTDPEGMHCYACCGKRDIEALHDTSKPFGAYVSSDGKRITSWPGATLMHVTRETKSRTGWHGSTLTHIRATDVHGRDWHGKGSGRGMCILMRACKA